MTTEVKFTVSEFIDICNQSLEYAFSGIIVEGEVASFKINQNKWVFFDLKEGDSSIGCFMSVYQLGIPLSDGMKIRVRAVPKLTRWGKFSLTVQGVMPVGEGTIKKSFELLKQKLTAEGLFDSTKKLPIPGNLTKIGVISSTAAAGYIDFLRILDNRWGGMKVSTINTQVQGLVAVEQIIRALEYFNNQSNVEIIALIRGGGSADDLSIFNDERLVRAIVASKIPVITGIGHEVDESLADLAANIRASTPSNAAERLTSDREAVMRQVQIRIEQIKGQLLNTINNAENKTTLQVKDLKNQLKQQIERRSQHLNETARVLESLNPEGVLRRGYAIVTGKLSPGSEITILTTKQTLTAEVIHVQERN